VVPNLAGVVLEGKYRLTQPLGEGGMGFVYAGEHIALRRPLAVKFLRPEMAHDATALARLRQEAVASSAIGSPHIVEILDLGTAPGGAPYIVMEFLRGRPLATLLAQMPVVPLPRIAHILCQTMLALHAAHARGIVHRDLKPENIFLVDSAEGDFAKLLDFGVSKVRGELSSSNLTQTGAVLGTPRFMAPEQAAGRRDVDHRVDIWAAGVILYRALTGRYPYDAENYNALLAQILMASPPPPHQVRPDIHPAVEAIILTALARDPGARYPTAEAFRQALAPFAVLQPTQAPAAGPAAHVPSPAPAPCGGWTPAAPHPPTAVSAPSFAMPYGGGSVAAPPSVQLSWGSGSVPGAVAREASAAAAPSSKRTALWVTLGALAAVAVGGATAWLAIARPWADERPARAAEAARTEPTPVPARPVAPVAPAVQVTPVAPTTPVAPPPTVVVVQPEAAAAGLDAGTAEPSTPDAVPDGAAQDYAGLDPAVAQVLAQLDMQGDGGPLPGADVTPEQAAERDLYVAVMTEVACKNIVVTQRLFQQPNFNPESLMTLEEQITAQVLLTHQVTPERYAELAERWGDDETAMMAYTTAMMRCGMAMAGAWTE
jgi:hypothetical protein